MSARAKKTGNGTYEFDDYMRQPDTRSKWQIFKDGLYNPAEGTILGRTKSRWGIVGLFYLGFYSLLAALCAGCTMGLLATIDEHKPKYTLGASLIGTNPGLGYRPMSDRSEDKSLIQYQSTNSTQIKHWVARLDDFLETYLNKTKLKNGGRSQMICDYKTPPTEGKVCAVEVSNWGRCTSAESYGFNNSAPCVFVKMNRIYDWVPEFYDPADLPAVMPTDLKDYIKSVNATDRSLLKTVWVSCDGEKAEDKKNIGEVAYLPTTRGFPGYYYPYENQPEYLSPVVAVQFKRPIRNKVINIECRAWAKNIVYRSYGGEKSGAVHFELKIKD